MNERLQRPQPLLSSPGSLLLPVLDRHSSRRSRCAERVDADWPRIRGLLDASQTTEALAAMERLAADMHELTPTDPTPYRPVLRQQRLLLYGNLVAAARHAGVEGIAQQVLARCRQWDTGLATEIAELCAQL